VTNASLSVQPAVALGQCILVVEDEMLVAMMLEGMLTDIGYRVILAGRVTKATGLAATEAIDCAILDVNVDGETSYPVATELRRRGIPFLFSTGYSAAALRADYRGSPVLSKPYSYSAEGLKRGP
jgi:DNA-binding response OmpR family regulator